MAFVIEHVRKRIMIGFAAQESNMSYRKVGGLRFVTIWRFGFSFYVKRRRAGLPQLHKHTLRDVARICF